VARELTKLHEEVLRGRASEVAQRIAERGGVKGEIVLVIRPVAQAPEASDVEAALAEALRQMSPARAAAELARRHRIPRKDLYRRALALKGEGDGDA
jgi:16S rRNA (cytidine1402-2'-O)-methyltransferase